MRWQAVATVLLWSASSAWAQPQSAPATGSGAGSAADSTEPTTDKPTNPPADTAKPDTTQPTSPTNAVPPSPAAPTVPVQSQRPPIEGEGFRFGSYGRAIAGSDLRGGKPKKILIVARGPRIVEDSYLELELSYGFVHPRLDADTVVVRPVMTLAFDGTLFHDTGQFDARPAIRNMFLDGRVNKELTLWAGSRMYRGDDIYLFDFWPLDDINTLGGGAKYTKKLSETNQADLAAHVGFNRLNNPFQYQQIDVANPVQGSTTIVQLNRQRVITSATATYTILPATDGGMGTKFRLHGEFHSLPAGTRKRDDGTFEALPYDTGFLVGAQVGVFGMATKASGLRRHLNLFARYAKGLAAFDELAQPTSFGPELKTGKANELSFGLSGNFDHELGQLMIGAYSRRFIDADQNTTDPDDGWEYAVGARPLARLASAVFAGADVSYQARFPKGLNAITLRAEDPAVFQIAPMLVWSPMGPSAYDRPQLRLVYRAAHLNGAALDSYVPDDPRRNHAWVHFLGLQAEWWFNSNTYR